ncbi:MAG TPA: helix-turn-helix transcriptional regulator [Gemmatimonadales bacterium]|nr:helix-turn-helix transcriptional regulator [Gemmatimonadales bacterium]
MLPLPILLGGLGRVIRRLRKQAGYSQERFGFAIGVHRTYMGHLERGTANPTVRTLHLVSRGLGISVVELVALAVSEGTEDQGPGRNQPRFEQTTSGPLRRVAEPSGRKPTRAKRRK